MNTNKHENIVSTAQIDKGVRDKFEEWKNILIGEDVHSIRHQIYEMIWDSAYFQCINESRKYVSKTENGEDKRNGMLHSFINQSFFKTQLLSIRRLVDKDSRGQKNRKYTVYSLYILIEDIKKHCDLLTRGNIIAYKNLPYDYGKAFNEYKKSIDCTKPYFVPDNIAESERIHQIIDSNTCTNAHSRCSDDFILVNIPKEFEDKLNEIETLCDYVDKYIAHSATPESRIKIPDKIDGALGKVFSAHKVICETASFIGNKLLFCGFGDVLPISRYGQFDQFDVFEYLNEPLATEETIEKMRKSWEKYRIETNQWNQL